jgi:hypothetical protein
VTGSSCVYYMELSTALLILERYEQL